MENNKYFAYYISKGKNLSGLSTLVPFTSKASALKWVLEEVRNKVQKRTKADMSEFFVEDETGRPVYSGIVNGKNIVYTVYDGAAVN